MPSALYELGLAFPRQRVNEATFKLYIEKTKAVPPELLARAVDALIRTSEFFPTVHALLTTCAELALELPSEASALAQIEHRLSWTRLTFDVEPSGLAPEVRPEVHPIVEEAVNRVGGYYAFRTATEPAVLRGQFLRLYKQIRADTIREAQLAPALPAGNQPKEIAQ